MASGSFRKALITVCGVLILSSATTSFTIAQTEGNQSMALTPEVDFLSETPVIDGILDDNLKYLPVREFIAIEKDDSDSLIPVNYRLGYGTDFLYLYIEAEADSIIFRDRAYQHGDGFHMVIAKPLPDNAPSEEFYVLACSAVDNPANEWCRHIFWYYNVDKIFIPTGDDTKMEFHNGDGIISFELYLPWEAIHPYHPWLSEGIGFNLAFVKALENGNRIRYEVLEACLGCENSPRDYLTMTFQQPVIDGLPQTFVLPERNHIKTDDTLRFRAATVASGPTEENMTTILRSGEKKAVNYTRDTYPCDAGVTIYSYALEPKVLPPGGYGIEYYSSVGDSRGEGAISIISDFDFDEISSRIEKMRGGISDGSLTTLQFQAQEIQEDLAKLYSYETCAIERIRHYRLLENIKKAEAGEDVIYDQTGFVRKAYRSKLDNTLQPYMAWLPDDFDPGKTYGLFVYLHGSASDETNIRGVRDLIPEGFIALGPKGRGPSNAYCRDNAQVDLAESIEAIMTDYPIDPDKIILSGFSMGGYGVYRTHFETPEKFRSLAIFSGTPVYFDECADFTQDDNTGVFKDTPMFIFHGGADRNLSIDGTREFVQQLKDAGAKVEFHVEEETGHERCNDETRAAYLEWIDHILQE